MVHGLHLPRVLLVVSAVCCVTVRDSASAQESPSKVITTESVTDAETAESITVPDQAADPNEQKRQAAVAALLVLCLVCVVFLFLILFVVMWSKRMRRLVNQPLHDQHPGDPLWYLRKADSDQVSETKPVSDSED